MKLAVAGKGGSGKTSIAGTMARLLGRGGRSVLAIDGDLNPNLALTVGIPAARINEVPALPRDLLRRDNGTFELTRSVAELRASHSVVGPDGVTLLVMAHTHRDDAGGGCFCGMHAAVRTVIDAISDTDADVCILDTEASPEHLARGTSKYAEAMLTVVEPYFKSLETGRRIAELGRGLGIERIGVLANKVRDERDLEAVREFASAHGLELAGVVPFDEALIEAERAGLAPLDHAPDAPAIGAIDEIARHVLAGGVAATATDAAIPGRGSCPWV